MKILLTGANGYIGSRVLNHLRNRSVPWKLFEWTREFGNLLSCEDFRSTLLNIKPDLAILSAWQTTQELNYELNPKHLAWTDFIISQVKICIESGVRPFVIGTVVDSQNSSSLSSYALAKYKLRILLNQYIESQEVTYLRLHYVLDEMSGKPRLLRDIQDHIARYQIFIPRNQTSFLDYIHIQDIVSAIEVAISQDYRGEIEICSGISRNTYAVANSAYLRAGLYYPHGHLAIEIEEGFPKPYPKLCNRGWKPFNTNLYFNLE